MQEIAKKQGILPQWLSWQYIYVPSAILQAWRNFLLFTFNYFSIPILLRTLFFYWRRYRYFYGRGFDLKRYFDAFTFNIISRVIGAIIRIIFIAIGALSEIFVIAGGLILLLGWFFLPLLIIGGLWLGIKLIFWACPVRQLRYPPATNFFEIWAGGKVIPG